jgi:hypothetical protein
MVLLVSVGLLLYSKHEGVVGEYCGDNIPIVLTTKRMSFTPRSGSDLTSIERGTVVSVPHPLKVPSIISFSVFETYLAQRTIRMNLGGFSWKRLLGISAFKSRVSREIGIPLTASGRRRKLGASIFKAVGPVAGTVAVAAIGAAKKLEQGTKRPSKPGPAKGVYFCQVKGVSHDNDDGTRIGE